MTPRTLLTAIGATAIAFAVAIGMAADQVSSQVAPTAASTTTIERVQPYGAPATLRANQECPIAV